MSYGLKITLPDEVLQHLLSVDQREWVPYLANFFVDSALKPYEESLHRRQPGALGKPLLRYEKTLLTDLLIDIALGTLREKIEVQKGSPQVVFTAREAVT